jgi:hypothetical protein
MDGTVLGGSQELLNPRKSKSPIVTLLSFAASKTGQRVDIEQLLTKYKGLRLMHHCGKFSKSAGRQAIAQQLGCLTA